MLTSMMRHRVPEVPMNRDKRGNRKYIDQLGSVEFFSQCSQRELRAVASFCTPIEVRAGRVLTEQGAHGRECFVVMHGQAVVERNGAIVGHIVDGSIIGEIALLGDGVRTATVTAATDMTLLVLSRSEFGALRGLGIATAAWECLDGIVAERLAQLERLATGAGDTSTQERMVPASAH
jgi:CRP/FNR family transcriptional regulator, cyclic AMP receptor protein